MPLSRPCHRARWRPLSWAIVLAAAAATLTVPAGAGAAAEPPLVVDGDDTPGAVRIAPETQQVTGPRVTWQLHNGGQETLTFDLALHAVEAAEEGATIGEPLADPTLAVDRLTLASGEHARIPVHLPDGAPRVLALVATTVDASPETTVSGLALLGADGTVTPEIVDADATAGTFTLRLAASGPALVDVAVRATAWPGRPTTTHRLDGVLVPTGGRDVVVRLDGPVAGRVTLDAAVTAGDDVGRTSRSVWWWPRCLLVLVAIAMVVVAASVLLVRRRRG